MSDATPRIETNDGVNVLIINGKLSRETTARHIVKVLDAHDALVAALEEARRDLRDYGAAPIQQVCEEMKQALEAVGSRNGEAKR